MKVVRPSKKERIIRIKKNIEESKTVLVSFRITQTLAKRLRTSCEKEEITMTDVIRDLIEEFLDDK
jgi:regulator of PEP synthase PpsR (kinase-PPPase family)